MISFSFDQRDITLPRSTIDSFGWVQRGGKYFVRMLVTRSDVIWVLLEGQWFEAGSG